MLNIREKIYYINVIYSIQEYVYAFYKALCQAWLLEKVEISGTKWENEKDCLYGLPYI